MKLLNTSDLEQFDEYGGYYKDGECGSNLGEMYLDCYEHKQVYFHQNKVRCSYK